MEIIPAILETNKEDFSAQIKNLLKFYDHLQIDIADGEFVKNKTLDTDSVAEVLQELNPDIRKKLILDLDLLVGNLEEELEKVEELEEIVAIKTIFARPASLENYKKLRNLYPEFEIGLAIDPTDSIETIAQSFDFEKVPAIQVMTVDPGVQGNPFLDDMLNKIEQLRMSDYRNKIYLDGGINDTSLKIIISRKYPPDVLCIGSYLTKAGDKLEERVRHLKKIALVT